jgi:hypothetical protein
MQPQAFYRVVADDFTAVDAIIRQQVVSRVPLVEKIGDYIISAGGKRLRPAAGVAERVVRWVIRPMTCACWPPPSSSCIPPPCCTTTWSTCPTCAVAAAPPMPNGVTRQVCWWATSFIHARSK